MKKVFLLLIFFCTLSFSDMGGFEDLKWGASREEVKEYLMKKFDLKETAFLEFPDSLDLNMKGVRFSDISIKNITFEFNKRGEFFSWRGETYTIAGDKINIKKLLIKEYNLIEKKNKENVTYLDTNSNKEWIDISFEPDKVTFICRDYYYWFKKN